ncbi:MAG: hypothetical protein HYZ81_09980, partial [Nitrospinae bacterium]|nr:hypothetical protein [Nitrospinota bacterium]
MSITRLKSALLLQSPFFSLLIDGIAGSALLACRWRKRASAVGTALLILLVVGAMGPHLVHHLFDADHGQTCL